MEESDSNLIRVPPCHPWFKTLPSLSCILDVTGDKLHTAGSSCNTHNPLSWTSAMAKRTARKALVGGTARLEKTDDETDPINGQLSARVKQMRGERGWSLDHSEW